MSEMDKVLVWPFSIKPINDLIESPETGVSIAKYRTGASIRRTYQDKPLAKFTAKFLVSPLDESYEDDMVWFRKIEDGLGTVLFKNPHADFEHSVILGIANGVQTSWVIPCVDWVGTPRIYADNVIQSLISIYYDGPNCLNFSQSICDYDYSDLIESGPVVATADKSYDILNSAYNRPVTKCVKTVGGIGYLSANVNLPVNLSQHINVMVDARGDAAIDPIARADSFNGTAIQITDDEWSVATKSLIVGGPTTVINNVGLYFTSGEAGTVYSGAMALTRGDIDVWYPGDVRMPVVVFNTAPAVGTIIKSKIDEANIMLRVMVSSVSHKIYPDGNRIITVKFEETEE